MTTSPVMKIQVILSFYVDVTRYKMLKELQSLKTFNSRGPGEIYSKLLKDITREILNPLAMLFTMPLAYGVIPIDWEMANVTPILKQGHRKLPDNYKPVY